MLLAFLGSTPDATADEYPSVQVLKGELARKYSFTTPEIAAALTIWGTKANGDAAYEAKLVRWIDGPHHIAIVITGDAKEQTEKFVESLSFTMSAIGRRGGYCAQTVSVSDDGGYYPSLSELSCLQKPYDVLMVVDASLVVPTMLFQDIRDRLQAPFEKTKWNQRARAGGDYFDHTSCVASFAINPDASAITSGSAYFRVTNNNVAGMPTVEDCIHVLPFLILAQQPIQATSVSSTYAEEMLQLFYSPELHAGMTKSEIVKLLGN
jgi:hypothetical protein